MNEDEHCLEIRTYFVRGKNALVARGCFTELYVEHYLTLSDHGLRFGEGLDAKFKEAVAAVCLYAACRPHDEVVAWTLHYEDPACNIFVTADNPAGKVVGTIHTENVRTTGKCLLYGDVLSGNNPLRRSTIEFCEGDSPFVAAGRFYLQSEQREARYFTHSEEDFVLVGAQPDCDLEWLKSLDEKAVRELDQKEELRLLEIRKFHWKCGCSLEKMMGILAPVMQRDPVALFGEDASVTMRCPRCGAAYQIAREELEKFCEGSAPSLPPVG